MDIVRLVCFVIYFSLIKNASMRRIVGTVPVDDICDLYGH